MTKSTPLVESVAEMIWEHHIWPKAWTWEKITKTSWRKHFQTDIKEHRTLARQLIHLIKKYEK